MRGVYVIVDLEALANAHIDPLAFARDVVQVRPAALQLRAKSATARQVVSLLEALKLICNNAGVPLVNNDRIDLAIATGCDMVHLGQTDASIEIARGLDARLGVGLSTHTPDELAYALKSRPSYVAYGPVFPTASKENHATPIGIDGLAHARKIISQSSSPDTPLVAIGGINAENAHAVSAYADAVAVIGGVVGRDPVARARAIQEPFGGAR